MSQEAKCSPPSNGFWIMFCSGLHYCEEACGIDINKHAWKQSSLLIRVLWFGQFSQGQTYIPLRVNICIWRVRHRLPFILCAISTLVTLSVVTQPWGMVLLENANFSNIDNEVWPHLVHHNYIQEYGWEGSWWKESAQCQKAGFCLVLYEWNVGHAVSMSSTWMCPRPVPDLQYNWKNIFEMNID